MDFGRILDDWEKMQHEREDSSPPLARKGAGADTSSADAAARGALEAWLAEHDVGDKDAESGEAAGDAESSREARRLATLKPEAALDLHGMTGEEAESAIADFLDSSSRIGLEKVLVIHGKGLHSTGLPVLKKTARRALEAHPLAGKFGEADKIDGGSGALWVLIRKRG